MFPYCCCSNNEGVNPVQIVPGRVTRNGVNTARAPTDKDYRGSRKTLRISSASGSDTFVSEVEMSSEIESNEAHDRSPRPVATSGRGRTGVKRRRRASGTTAISVVYRIAHYYNILLTRYNIMAYYFSECFISGSVRAKRLCRQPSKQTLLPATPRKQPQTHNLIKQGIHHTSSSQNASAQHLDTIYCACALTQLHLLSTYYWFQKSQTVK